MGSEDVSKGSVGHGVGADIGRGEPCSADPFDLVDIFGALQCGGGGGNGVGGWFSGLGGGGGAARTMRSDVQSFFVGKRRHAWRTTEPRGNCVVPLEVASGIAISCGDGDPGSGDGGRGMGSGMWLGEEHHVS